VGERGGEGDQEDCGRDGCMEGRSERAHALLGRSIAQLLCLLYTFENAPCCPRRHSDHFRAIAGLGVPHVIFVETTGVLRRLLEWDEKEEDHLILPLRPILGLQLCVKDKLHITLSKLVRLLPRLIQCIYCTV
jgi:hypothetical protein